MTATPAAGTGVALLYTAIVLLVLTWFTFILRCWVRVVRKTWGSDDYLMLIGLILFSVTAALCIVCSFHGSGQLAADVPPLTRAKGIKLFYIAEYFYAVSAAFIKCSIAVTLLRLSAAHRSIELSLWAVISMTCIAALVFCVGIANICHPINTLWGASNGTCNLKLNSDVSLFFSAIEIITDWSLALLPAILLWSVQMKSSVKISVAVILALASFASCATIVRLRYLTLYSDPGEFLFGTGPIGFWSLMEEGIGLIAGSLPALRPLLSLRITMTSSATPAGAHSGNDFPSSRTRPIDHDRFLMQDTVVCPEEGEVDFGDADSQKNIVKETRYTISSAPAGATDSKHVDPRAWSGV